MSDEHRRNHEDDPFSNFQFEPPRGHGRFRAFTRRSKYRNIVSSRDKLGPKLGSSSSLASLTGSTQNLLDPVKMMSMQEDARSRRISAEVMKNRLYESVVTSPRKRRFSMRVDYGMSQSEVADPQAYARMVQSLPVSPAHSQSITPAHSPTSNRSYMFGFFSRGATPHCMTPEELVEDEMSEMECEDAHWKGLACLFKPQPRYIPGARYSRGYEENMECDDQQGRESPVLPPPEYPGILLKTVPRTRKRAPSPDQDMNGEEPPPHV